MSDSIQHFKSRTLVVKSQHGPVGIWTSSEGDADREEIEALFSLLDGRGKSGDVFDILKQNVSTNPEDAQAKALLAAHMLNRGDPVQEIIPIILAAVRLSPLTANIRYTLGMAYYFASRYSDARRELRAVKLLSTDFCLHRYADQMLTRVVESGDAASSSNMSQPGFFSEDLAVEIQKAAPGPIYALRRSDVATTGIVNCLRHMLTFDQENIWIRYNLAAALIGVGNVAEGARELAIMADLAKSLSNERAATVAAKLLADVTRRPFS